MKTPIRRLLAVSIASLLLAGTAQAQLSPPAAPSGSESSFTPHSGQAGKDVVWVPTPQALVDRMLDMAKLTADDYVIDLGSGDGRTVITAAKRGARAHGIEYNPEMVTLSQQNAKKEGVSGKATFVQGDIFQSDFSKATLITLFLLPDLNLRLRPLLLDMKPGTRVVSNSFNMGDWEPDQNIEAGSDCVSWCRAYKWVIPAKAQGTWNFKGGSLELAQTFQKLKGTLTVGGKALPIENARMDGPQISFAAGGVTYTGQVVDREMTVKGSNGQSWKADRRAG